MAKPKITLTAHDHARISAAVTAAESHSCGEITTILADQSDSYHDITLIWSALVALAALVALSIAPNVYLGAVDRLMGWWGSHWQASSLFALATGVVTVKFAAMWLLLRWRWLRLALVPGPSTMPACAPAPSPAIALPPISALRRPPASSSICPGPNAGRKSLPTPPSAPACPPKSGAQRWPACLTISGRTAWPMG